MMARTKCLLAVTVLVSSGLLVCDEPVPSPTQADLGQYDIRVTGLQARYDHATGKVECTWNTPSRVPDFYNIYRGVSPKPGDTLEMVSEGKRFGIAGGQQSFSDVVGLENTVYYYEIRGGLAEEVDTVIDESGSRRLYLVDYSVGPPSNRVACRVGTGISFSINDGDLFTRYDTCHLTVLDRNRLLAGVDFSSTSSITSPVSVQMANDTSVTVPWTLPRGEGVKHAYARLRYKSGREEIRSDDIEIEPYRVNIQIRNEIKEPNETMRVQYAKNDRGEWITEQRKTADVYTVYVPSVEFGVSIFSDPSFDTTFDYWIVFPAADPVLKGGTLDSVQLGSQGQVLRGGFTHDNRWWHTRARRGRLTGLGGIHDDMYRYRYTLYAHRDSTQDGVHNLSELYADAGTGAQTTTYSGTLVNNEYDTFDSLVHMTNLYSNGRKEFAIIARFRGRFFGEDRIVISSGRIRRAQSYVSYYDAYPPVCKRDSWEFYFPDDGSTIDGALYIDLNSDGEIYDDGEQQTNRGVVEDRGGADVASIDLVVAEMPDELVASWDRSTYRDITLEQLYSYRHRVFPFEVGKRDDASKVYPVRWGPIDPSGWDTGWYLIAIVASDEYGNRGICPFKKAGGRGYNTNPQHWRIVTGSVGL